jgi:hypothetical protein
MLALIRILNIKRENIYPSRIAKAVLRRIKDVPKVVSWYLPFGYAKLNRKRLKQFHNIHKGKRGFIIANGPSLRNIDFNKLKDEITIGMNRIYLLKEDKGFLPTYLASIAIKTQLVQFNQDYDNLEITCFFPWNYRGNMSKKSNQYFIKDKFSPKFTYDLTKRIGSGKSVTYACIQIAFYMGFDEVYLIGKDHSYNTEARTGTYFISDGNETNHFIKGYYKPGMVWDAPDYETEEFVYRLSEKAFKKNGRKIFDATINGKLDVFEKVIFNELFK